MTEKTYKEGIYFNMPEEEYHDIPYFSRSMSENMNVDAQEAWYHSPFNPQKPENEPTAQMQLGTAVHSMLLEPDVFEKLYVTRPTIDDFSGKIVLDKNAELQDFLASVGEKKTGKKEDLIARAEPYLDPSKYVIWDNVMSSYYQEIQDYGKREISASDVEILSGIKKNLDESEEIKQILQEGYPEVTIIWKDEETGIMCKCRLDWVRIEAIGEVKTFSMKFKKNLRKAMRDTINYERYNVQFAVYQVALENIIKKVKAGKAEVFGEVKKEWLAEFLKNSVKQFFIIFARTQAPYQVRAIELQRAYTEGASQNVYFSEGYLSFRSGITQYASYLKQFGDKPWKESKEVETLMDEEVPGIMYQNMN